MGSSNVLLLGVNRIHHRDSTSLGWVDFEFFFHLEQKSPGDICCIPFKSEENIKRGPLCIREVSFS
jgi:hypothetical protein